MIIPDDPDESIRALTQRPGSRSPYLTILAAVEGQEQHITQPGDCALYGSACQASLYIIEPLPKLRYRKELTAHPRDRLRRHRRKEPLTPHAIGLHSSKRASMIGPENVPEILLNPRGPLSRVSPEEQIVVPQSPYTSHLGVQERQFHSGTPAPITSATALIRLCASPKVTAKGTSVSERRVRNLASTTIPALPPLPTKDRWSSSRTSRRWPLGSTILADRTFSLNQPYSNDPPEAIYRQPPADGGSRSARGVDGEAPPPITQVVV
jgi:hypothetical protein